MLIDPQPEDDDLSPEEYAELEELLQPYMTDGKLDFKKLEANSIEMTLGQLKDEITGLMTQAEIEEGIRAFELQHGFDSDHLLKLAAAGTQPDTYEVMDWLSLLRYRQSREKGTDNE